MTMLSHDYGVVIHKREKTPSLQGEEEAVSLIISWLYKHEIESMLGCLQHRETSKPGY